MDPGYLSNQCTQAFTCANLLGHTADININKGSTSLIIIENEVHYEDTALVPAFTYIYVPMEVTNNDVVHYWINFSTCDPLFAKQ